MLTALPGRTCPARCLFAEDPTRRAVPLKLESTSAISFTQDAHRADSATLSKEVQFYASFLQKNLITPKILARFKLCE